MKNFPPAKIFSSMSRRPSVPVSGVWDDLSILLINIKNFPPAKKSLAVCLGGHLCQFPRVWDDLPINLELALTYKFFSCNNYIRACFRSSPPEGHLKLSPRYVEQFARGGLSWEGNPPVSSILAIFIVSRH